MHNSGSWDDVIIFIYTILDNIQYLNASTTLFSDGTLNRASTQLFTIHSLVLGYTSHWLMPKQ